jgi:hypothetical protein
MDGDQQADETLAQVIEQMVPLVAQVNDLATQLSVFLHGQTVTAEQQSIAIRRQLEPSG